MGIKEFVIVALDLEYKAFVVYIAALSINSGDKVHHSKKVEISHLKVDEALTKVFNEYADFTDVFSSKLAAKLPKHIEINNHTIELLND